MMGDCAGESDNNPVDGGELYTVGGWPSWGWCATISLAQWVTIPMMVGSIPHVGGWPTFGWWGTILGMVGDHPLENGWPSSGRLVIIFFMLRDNPKDGVWPSWGLGQADLVSAEHVDKMVTHYLWWLAEVGWLAVRWTCRRNGNKLPMIMILDLKRIFQSKPFVKKMLGLQNSLVKRRSGSSVLGFKSFLGLTNLHPEFLLVTNIRIQKRILG